ncbi:hypothetical protein V8F06_006978 [Rhypophila decipiens]
MMETLPPMRPLDPYDRRYRKIQAKFEKGWLHDGKRANIRTIYAVDEDDLDRSYSGRRFNKYVTLSGGKCSLLFHGTRRTCRIGNDHERQLEPCYDGGCHLCCILRDSLSVRKAGPGGMFGPGIYTTDISSKADIYAKNHHLRSSKHAMLVCRVANNKPQYLTKAEYHRFAPDPGYDCVEAVTLANGGSVRFPETVVYSDDAIVPVALIIYTREGWDGRY